MKTTRILALLLASGLLAAACSAPEPTPTPSPTPTATPTATATSTPSPTPAPTATATATPSPTPARPSPTPTAPPISVPDSFATYKDQSFGFTLRYPKEWKVEETQGNPPQLAFISGPGAAASAPIQGIVSLIYNSEMTPADAVADNLLPQFTDREGFRTLEEREVTLLGGDPAFQIAFQWRTASGLSQGLLQTTSKDSRSFVMLLEGAQQEFQANAQAIQATFYSLHPQEPTPLGIPRSQALTLYFDDGPLTLDPAIAQESQSIQYIMQLYSGLISFGPDLALKAEVAKGWEVSGDGTVYTFTLRENARFHDGRKVTAQDVKYSWERAAGHTLSPIASPTVGTYLDDIVGVADVIQGKATEISGVEVVNEATLKVTIDAPKAYFLAKLSHPVAFLVDRSNVEASTGSLAPWWLTPNATGPFSMNTWEPGRLLVLDANKDFYGVPPAVPHVAFYLFGGVPTQMYKTGEIDIAHVFPDELSEIRAPANPLSKEMVETPELSLFYVGLASDKPPFNDPLVRRAFLMATDRQKLLTDIYSDSQTLSQGFMPTGLPGYNPAVPPIPFDPAKAKELLAQSSFKGPEGLPRIVYLTTGTTGPSALVTALANMWKANLGVQVEPTLVSGSNYFYLLPDIIRIGHIFDYGWIADYPDPHNFLDVLFHSGVQNNVGKYSSKEVDALLDKARIEPDREQRVQLYQQAEALMVQDAAAIPLYFGRDYSLVKPYVKGLVFSPFGMVDLKGVSLAAR
ncbi:MAG: peptide ABC transporter substrate-binding protein [Chloroflexi bacterium]|nr:peptide ABC transporter substrate-binding protein [Chloroflexota bacterium]